MNAAPHTRGWCPGMLRPMQTGDGLLVRLHPPLGILNAARMRSIAEAARRFGNGLIDVSSRGNLQIRGVTDETHPALVEHLLRAGVPDGTRAESPFRLTITSPLAGIDPTDLIDAHTLAETIEVTCADLLGLPAKTAVVIDGGGAMPLDGIEADLRLVAIATPYGPRIAIGLMGAEWIGTVAVEASSETVRDILARYAAIRRDDPDTIRRMRDVAPSLRTNLINAIERDAPVLLRKRSDRQRVGIVSLNEDRAVLFALPYGRCDADLFARIAGWSEGFGRGEARLSPWRSVALTGLSAARASRVLALAADAGLIVSANDPRLRIAACPGAPACASGTTTTHADAARLASLLPEGVSLHVSGCAKGCAHPGPSDVTLVGHEGLYDVVLSGNARDKPVSRVPISDMITRTDFLAKTQR
ncbi:precorrin-3B synthase [Microvirga sp. 2MCAF38]|uniref:precorrin-3B synthase n=1 Tax=Microvirga sp. 2MCAF38 TaxID=3232989 RepID=UPI003F9B56C8